jgi:protein-disulfide isomerase
MKRALLSLSLSLLLCTALEAQRLDPNAQLRDYASKVLPRCPGGALILEPMQGGPSNFNAYSVTLKSSDQYCGVQKYLLHSPKTQQVVVGTVIPLPDDGRATNLRIAETSGKLLNAQAKVIVAPFPLPDGLKAVTISRDTPFGTFGYQGFVDQSERFLLVGFRGNLTSDPAKALREALGAGVKRGSGRAEVIELSDFQCPTCAVAHGKIEPMIQKNLAKLDYTRIDLPLFEHHEWSVPAAMGARAIQRVAPAKYWKYVDYIFSNQELIGKRGDFDKVLREWAEDNEVDFAAINRIYSSKAERQALLDQVSRAFALGIASTPTYVVNGQIMGFGPEGAFTIEAIKSAIGAPAPAAAKPAAKKSPAKPAKKKSGK